MRYDTISRRRYLDDARAYRGDAPALADTMAGRVNLQIGGSAMLEQIRRAPTFSAGVGELFPG